MARIIFSEFASGRFLAARAVNAAKKVGFPKARTKVCVDCGKPAIDYDHRDYNKPLEVDPVCRSCNLSRGAAVPISWTFDQFMVWAQTCATSRRLLDDAEALARLKANHFTGPGGIAVPMTRNKQPEAA